MSWIHHCAPKSFMYYLVARLLRSNQSYVLEDRPYVRKIRKLDVNINNPTTQQGNNVVIRLVHLNTWLRGPHHIYLMQLHKL